MNSVVLWLPRNSAPHFTDARTETRVHGLGLYETMPGTLILRPGGSGDYLFMHFHDSVQVSIDEELRDVSANTFFIWTPADSYHFGHPDKPWKHSWIHCDGHVLAKDIADSNLPIGRPLTSRTPRWQIAT